MKKLAVLALVLAAPTVAQAQAMPISEFLSRADALKKKGPMALFSGDIKKLKGEIENSAKQLRAERLAGQKAGRKPTYCPPAKGSIDSDELLTHFQSIPPAQRGMNVKAGLAGLMRKKYPCPA